MQNIGKQIRAVVVKRVRKTKFFAVLMDETNNTSRKEHVSVTLRYVSNERGVSEEFISFAEAPNVTGEELGNILLTKLTTLGRLDIADLRWKGRLRRGPRHVRRFNGCQAVVQRHQPLASYTH